MTDAFNRAVRQAALAIAYDFSVVTEEEFGEVDWPGQPSVARLRFLFPDATMAEAHDASQACRCWAEAQEESARIIFFECPDCGADLAVSKHGPSCKRAAHSAGGSKGS